jgi:hypothetical protein
MVDTSKAIIVRNGCIVKNRFAEKTGRMHIFGTYRWDGVVVKGLCTAGNEYPSMMEVQLVYSSDESDFLRHLGGCLSYE